jgi:tRNA(Ile2)-agmatinylcytidine synthase
LPTEFHIGIDDTDSRTSGCTTYTAAVLIEELSNRGFQTTDFPWLVRLNPNIPWKTRGNGALALHLEVSHNESEQVKKITIETVQNTIERPAPSTDPAVVFLAGPAPYILKEFSTRALHDVLSVSDARKLARIIGAEIHVFGKSRGIIGALAALGAPLEGDHTFEIVAYRTRENLGTPRRVNIDSIRRMDAEYHGRTFNNIDPETRRILICPHGPDPVLFGIRGEDPESLVGAFRTIRADEPVERIMIFKTNSGTDAHLTVQRTTQTLKLYMAAVVSGRVQSTPKILRGGHAVVVMEDDTGTIECAAFESTGPVRDVVRQLVPGDVLKVYGGVHRGPNLQLTLNLEKVEVLGLAETFEMKNPYCLACGSRCESMGTRQGFRCRRCFLRYPNASKLRVIKPRKVATGIFLPPPRAHRHLTKPMSRSTDTIENGKHSTMPFQGIEYFTIAGLGTKTQY